MREILILLKAGLLNYLAFDFFPIFCSCNISLALILPSNTEFFHLFSAKYCLEHSPSIHNMKNCKYRLYLETFIPKYLSHYQLYSPCSAIVDIYQFFPFIQYFPFVFSTPNYYGLFGLSRNLFFVSQSLE